MKKRKKTSEYLKYNSQREDGPGYSKRSKQWLWSKLKKCNWIQNVHSLYEQHKWIWKKNLLEWSET